MTKSPITISVITPNFNYAKYLPECLDSVVTQGTPPFEFIIVDDASTDNSAEIIESYRRRYPFIRFFRWEQNRGILYNMSFLLAEAKGSHILGLGSDDRIEPGYLAAVTAATELNPEAALLFGDMLVLNVDTGAQSGIAYPLGCKTHYFSPTEAPTALGVWNPHGQSIVRLEALRAIGGFQTKFLWLTDWFTYYTLAYTYGFTYVPGCWGLFRTHRTSYAGRVSKMLRYRTIKLMLRHLNAGPADVRDQFVKGNALASQSLEAFAAMLTTRGGTKFLTIRFVAHVLSPRALFEFGCTLFPPAVKKPIKWLLGRNQPHLQN